MTSAAWRASFGNDGSPMRSPSGRMNSHLPGVLLHRILQELEKFRDGRQNPVPVGDERETSRILDEFVRGRAQALCKDCHGQFLAMRVKLETVQHGIRVIAGDCVLGHADVSNLQTTEMVRRKHHAFGCKRGEERLRDVGSHSRKALGAVSYTHLTLPTILRA